MVALLLVLLIVATSIAGYLTLTGRSLALLRFGAARVARLLAGQRTQQLALDLQVQPTEGRLAGTATVNVQSFESGRQRFYFLLNNGLRLKRVQAQTDDRPPHRATSYQLGVLAVIDVGAPVPKDGTAKLIFTYEGAPAADMYHRSPPSLNPQRVHLGADAFWYPTDLQGFFDAQVTVTLPVSLTVVHNGAKAEVFRRGDLQQVRWSSPRPVGGLSLIAGNFTLSTKQAAGTTYRLYLPLDVRVDSERMLEAMADSESILEQRYGPSGFTQVTLFVDRALRHGFNDGSGLVALSAADLRRGDYGFGRLAHELAHNWWGGTVAPDWLAPDTGGAWLVESLAEFSSVVASEIRYGDAAGWRRRSEAFFDPGWTTVVEQLSLVERAAAEPLARELVDRKGTYVALMLRHALGDEACFAGLREFLQRFRFQHATARNLQQVLQDTSGQQLEHFFTDWLRSDHQLDLALTGKEPSQTTVENAGKAALVGDVDLWTFHKNASEPEPTVVHVGDHLPISQDADHVVLDPLLQWADMQRDNNRAPRSLTAFAVAASRRGELAVTQGEGFTWMRSSVAQLTADGRTVHAWDFPRGMTEPPTWFPDGGRILLSYSDGPGALPQILTVAGDGTQHRLGRGVTPAAAADGTVYAGQDNRIMRFDTRGRESTVVEYRGARLERPIPSPDGSRLAYTAHRGDRLQIRAVNRDGSDDRLILSWDDDRTRYRWAADGVHLYVSLAGDWDWQIWEVPVDTGSVITLVTGAAAISDLALSPDGSQLAFTAMPDLDYPNQRHVLYIMRLRDQVARAVDLPDIDLGPVTWIDGETMVAVATAAANGQRWMLPATRTLKRIRVADGSVGEWP